MFKLIALLSFSVCLYAQYEFFPWLDLPDGALLPILETDPNLLWQQDPSEAYAIGYLVTYGRTHLLEELVMGNHHIVYGAIRRNLYFVVRFIAENVRGTWPTGEKASMTPLAYARGKRVHSQIVDLLKERGTDRWWTPSEKEF